MALTVWRNSLDVSPRLSPSSISEMNEFQFKTQWPPLKGKWRSKWLKFSKSSTSPVFPIQSRDAMTSTRGPQFETSFVEKRSAGIVRYRRELNVWPTEHETQFTSSSFVLARVFMNRDIIEDLWNSFLETDRFIGRFEMFVRIFYFSNLLIRHVDKACLFIFKKKTTNAISSDGII